MTKQEIIEKIKLAEEISNASKKFPEMTYKIILNSLLFAKTEEKNKEEKQTGINVKKKSQKSIKKKSGKGLSQKINDLISEGFFDEIKTSKEIIAKLKKKTYQIKSTSLPSYLIPMVRNGELEREEVETKNGKIYGYIRKG